MIWHPITLEAWDAAQECAASSEAKFKAAGYDRDWNPIRHLLGCLGDQFVRELLGLEWDRYRQGAGSDGGVDVVDADVKCYELGKTELHAEAAKRNWATWFIVVLADLRDPDARRRAVLGHTHKRELQAAPVRQLYVPTLCLPLAELQPGLPPHLVLESGGGLARDVRAVARRVPAARSVVRVRGRGGALRRVRLRVRLESDPAALLGLRGRSLPVRPRRAPVRRSSVPQGDQARWAIWLIFNPPLASRASVRERLDTRSERSGGSRKERSPAEVETHRQEAAREQ